MLIFALVGYAFKVTGPPQGRATRTAPLGWAARQLRLPVSVLRAAEGAEESADVIGDYCAAHGGARPIRKILIANNGMAATKSVMSMRQWAYMEVPAIVYVCLCSMLLRLHRHCGKRFTANLTVGDVAPSCNDARFSCCGLT
jgi:hypothetical protein